VTVNRCFGESNRNKSNKTDILNSEFIGRVNITTRGGENIKLGLANIVLENTETKQKLRSKTKDQRPKIFFKPSPSPPELRRDRPRADRRRARGCGRDRAARATHR